MERFVFITFQFGGVVQMSAKSEVDINNDEGWDKVPAWLVKSGDYLLVDGVWRLVSSVK